MKIAQTFTKIFALSLLFFGPGLFISHAQITATFEVANLEIKEGNCEFDILMSANKLGSFHSRGQVYVKFNEEAFEKVETLAKVTPLELVNQKDEVTKSNKYTLVNVIENTGKLAITWSSNFLGIPGASQFHTEVRTIPTKLFHISIPMKDPDMESGISLAGKLMKGQTFYLTEETRFEAAYDAPSAPTE